LRDFEKFGLSFDRRQGVTTQLDARKKAIWIDLDNSPHVPLFAPLIRHYRDSGVEVVLTARDHSQTIGLLQLKGFEGTFEVIGRHYGKSKIAKIRGLIARSSELASYINKLRATGTDIAVAVSHGSRSMVLASRWLTIPILTMYDYEFTETRIFNQFSDKVLVPDKIPDTVLDDLGLRRSKREKYPGIKEELYVRNFKPSVDFLKELLRGDPGEKILVVLRPPATTANYHSDESEHLLDEILRRLSEGEDVFTVVVPRTPDQAEEIRSKLADVYSQTDFLVLDDPVDGLDLAFAADLVISGGGTMNREAALLGVPVYSFFAGRQGALDAQMEKDGLVKFIRTREDVAAISLEKRNRAAPNGLTDRVERFVIEQINPFLEKG
jgi:predicted glycosyltransferase